MQLNSTNKTILVLSDPHQEINKLERILNSENYDIAVCLGDYFDSFTHNGFKDVEKTCQFLKKWLYKDNFFTTIGNHDISYLNSNRYAYCSGYTDAKDTLITDIFGVKFPEIKSKFKWYLWIDDFLCSHAGINQYHFPPNLKLDKPSISAWLDTQIKMAQIALDSGSSHWMFRAGTARGGNELVGGITWQDFDIEFEPIEGIKQLVGHTPHPTILNHRSDGNINLTECDNLDIDCHLNEYLLITNEKLTIKRYSDL